ncbi:MAG TPA: four helix bundle protein [Bacteroidales bacterium]|nr:four helix bundle protein [Bacteroidales bacterium]
MGNFKNLNVWLKAKNLAVNIYKLTDQALYNKDFSMKDQMRRSAISIPSNIAEGDALDTNKQSIKYFHIARGSTAELRTQLIISMEVGYIKSDLYKELELECDEIGAMLTSLIKHRLNKTSNQKMTST